MPGSAQLGLAKRLLERYEWWRFEPHPEWAEPHWTKENYSAPYAAGIPVVSTTVGAEGLAGGGVCAIADEPAAFAGEILRLFDDPEEGAAMAERARALVTSRFAMRVMTRNLAVNFREAVRAKRAKEDVSV